MNVAHDVYAETNPAFCAAVVAGFTKAYLAEQPEGPEAPLAYVAVPLALSGDLASSFDGTNKATSLLEWLQRSPQVQVGVADRINASLQIVSDGIRLGCFVGLLAIGDGARLKLGEKAIKAAALSALGQEPQGAIKRASRLGHWFAVAGTTRTVFDAIGLTL